MKKKLILIFLSIISCSVYSEKVGEEIYYSNAPIIYRRVQTYLTKVAPINESEYYNVELTSIVSPADSAVGKFTFTTHYVLKEKDSITLYDGDFTGRKPHRMIVKKISTNEIQFSTAVEVLNEE